MITTDIRQQKDSKDSFKAEETLKAVQGQIEPDSNQLHLASCLCL